jgi:hypothetical protein
MLTAVLGLVNIGENPPSIATGERLYSTTGSFSI